MNKKTVGRRFVYAVGKKKRKFRIRSCLFHVWLVAPSNFLLQFRLFFRRNECCECMLRKFLKCRGVVVNSKHWLWERRLNPVLLQGLTVNFVVLAVDQNNFDCNLQNIETRKNSQPHCFVSRTKSKTKKIEI